FLMTMYSFARVFDNGGKRRIRQGKSFGIFTVECVCQYAQRVGIAFEVDYIFPLLSSATLIKLPTSAIHKHRRYSRFAGVPECRVAQVMGQTGRRHNITDLLQIRSFLINLWIESLHPMIKQATQRSTYGSYLQAVRQSIVDKNRPRKWENLRFVLQ